MLNQHVSIIAFDVHVENDPLKVDIHLMNNDQTVAE